MKLEEYAKKLGLKKDELEALGLESESDETSYAESLRELLLRITKDFESLLHPEMGFTLMIEHSYLEEKEIKILFEVFKTYNKLLREYEIAKLENNLGDWGRNFFKIWNEWKEKVIAINKKLASSWESQDTKSLMLEYLG